MSKIDYTKQLKLLSTVKEIEFAYSTNSTSAHSDIAIYIYDCFDFKWILDAT